MEENNKLAIKTFDIDYSFIIENYLDRKLWNKTWTLFQYKTMTVTFSLHRIDIYDNSVYFKVKVNNLEGHEYYVTPYYFIDKCDIKFLKAKIESAVFECLYAVERSLVRESIPETFGVLERVETKKIEDTVKEYFENLGVSSDSIIDATIDACENEFCKADSYKNAYIDNMKGKFLYEYLDVFANAVDKEFKIAEEDSNESLIRARKRLSAINETSVLEDEIQKYLNGEDYDVDLRMED